LTLAPHLPLAHGPAAHADIRVSTPPLSDDQSREHTDATADQDRDADPDPHVHEDANADGDSDLDAGHADGNADGRLRPASQHFVARADSDSALTVE